MNSECFVYWLQGFFEILGETPKSLTEKQIQMIKDHLGYVFEHIKAPLKVIGALDTQSMTPEQVKKAMEEFQKTWVPSFTLSDVKYC